MSGVKDEDMALIFDKVAEYELSIPRINSHITKMPYWKIVRDGGRVFSTGLSEKMITMR